MCSTESIFKDHLTKEQLEEIIHDIERSIPMGFNHNKSPCTDNEMPQKKSTDVIRKIYNDAKFQLGTLGGGK